MLTHVTGVENPVADYLSCLELRPQDGPSLKLTDPISVFQVDIDIASKTAVQEEGETHYYTRGEADDNIQKHRSNDSDDKALGHREHEHPRAIENDIHQMTAHGDAGHRKTSLKDQMTFFRLVNTGLLRPRANNSKSLSTTVHLQVVQETMGTYKKLGQYF